ncbi:hypothetical protein H2198_003676 [Neophaeococcomyces mojaviensis]|uniref:Uncharacterized protein n=1 Tax=Neophaeococcomyces mojaviensis TaxID=3383035 RepID=A0ACC3AAY5_9EURO|nr:hypothetical protein H2198_003676 [Knufia sp. JES_112]
MSNPAQDEADRIFNYKQTAASHPEDRDRDDLASDADDEKPVRRTIYSSNQEEAEDQDTDDEDTTRNIATMTGTKTTYTLPSTVQYANTGPKGVIADAQNYHKARRSTFRRTIHSISNNLSFGPKRRHSPEKNGNTSSGSDIDLGDDDGFMQQWRQQRLAELQEQFASTPQEMRMSPGQRTYGSLDNVDANGYLDAIEMAPKETNVVVLLFDPRSKRSLEVEDELKMMAYQWSHIHFVKLHHEIAEMETVQIPAILAYKGGNVFATISGAEREGLEDVLRGQGILRR